MAYQSWNADNAALLFIDHPIGTFAWVLSASRADCKRITLALANTAAATGISTLLT